MQKVCNNCKQPIDNEIDVCRVIEAKTVSLPVPAWKEKEADYCEKCQNKMLAEVYKMGWDLHKQQRKPKNDKARNTKTD